MQLLCSQRVDPNAVDSCGTSALMCCAYAAGGAAVADMLLLAGADIGLRNRQGQTPLMWAARFANQPLLAQLLRAGANPHACCCRGFRAIDYARALGHASVAAAFGEPDWVGLLPQPIRSPVLNLLQGLKTRLKERKIRPIERREQEKPRPDSRPWRPAAPFATAADHNAHHPMLQLPSDLLLHVLMLVGPQVASNGKRICRGMRQTCQALPFQFQSLAVLYPPTARSRSALSPERSLPVRLYPGRAF